MPVRKVAEERFDPYLNNMGLIHKMLHLYRYEKASEILGGFFENSRGMNVDIGCGVGYGTHMLTSNKIDTLGIDSDKDVIRTARERYPNLRNHFVVGSIFNLPFETKTVDSIVCFEVLEHLSSVELALKEIYRVLKHGGLFIFSSPNKAAFTTDNPYHINEKTLEEMQYY